ncbi:MAG: DUF2520 domain-containing protein [Tenacibaculum sp.]|nr:DUF2520 domain-containing protein [Tenacibaculum sp.]
MISVIILGYGNLAYHLTNTFLKTKNINVKQVYNRSIKKIEHLKNKTLITDNLKNLEKADVYIISVSDNAIKNISSKIDLKNCFVVHTSGATSINDLKNNGRKGVFYPLQSFSKNKEVNFNEIPFCLEAQYNEDLELLKQLALLISKKIYSINSEQRKQLHLSAVFVNNFTNYMYKIGDDICNKYNIPFEILLPLIKETALKVEYLSPKEAQTGPAIRNDEITIKNHLKLLNEEQHKIYKLLTKSIQNG